MMWEKMRFVSKEGDLAMKMYELCCNTYCRTNVADCERMQTPQFRNLNENLITICEKYGYNIPRANEQVLNRYIKDILKDLSEQLPSLKEKVPTKLTMKQKEALIKEKKEPETDLNGNVIVPRYECVTSHTARRTGITNMYLSHRYTILQMMHVSGHKTQKTFMDYIKPSSEEIAEEMKLADELEAQVWL